MKKFLKQLGWTALLGLGLLTGCSSDDEVVEPVVVNPKDASIRELVEQEELYNGQTVRTFGKVVAISDHDYIENLNPQHDVTIRILNTFLHKVDLFRTYSLEKADKAIN